ncbi:putative quinol monooxygenase [Kordiimonas marina]|uniref:putative quinol monooxygenase n=1 Tax=Kordiimonas marina TaxID=2872312 RepID=UPI001FF1345E|nr:antibiotic biosynthesis monooxygenase [Kordiimonas marina]
MIIVAGTIEVAPEYRHEALEACVEFVTASRREFGNLRYDISEDIDIPGLFRVYEEWEAQEALIRHMKAPYTVLFRKALADIQVLAINVQRYTAEPFKPAKR